MRNDIRVLINLIDRDSNESFASTSLKLNGPDGKILYGEYTLPFYKGHLMKKIENLDPSLKLGSEIRIRIEPPSFTPPSSPTTM